MKFLAFNVLALAWRLLGLLDLLGFLVGLLVWRGCLDLLGLLALLGLPGLLDLLGVLASPCLLASLFTTLLACFALLPFFFLVGVLPWVGFQKLLGLLG